jgi:hypothetical protein
MYETLLGKELKRDMLSEDFFFCHNYREHGGTVWAAPWCELGHFGSYLFSGQYSQGA